MNKYKYFVFSTQAMKRESDDLAESLTTTQQSTDDKRRSAAVNSLVMAASFGQLHMENLSKPLTIMYRHRMKARI